LSIYAAEPAADAEGEDQANAGAALSLFDRFFLMSTSSDGGDLRRYSDSDLNRMSSVLLFNLGLACHFRGAQGETKQGNLVTARKLYRMSLHLLEAAAVQENEDEGDDEEGIEQDGATASTLPHVEECDLMIYLGCVNNLACIFSHFFQSEQAKVCVRDLKYALHRYRQLPTAMNNSSSNIGISGRHLDVSLFSMNVFQCDGREISATAPAA